MGRLCLLVALAACTPAAGPSGEPTTSGPHALWSDLTIVTPRPGRPLPGPRVLGVREELPFAQAVTFDPMASVDVLVIGGGPAGLAAAADAIESGAKVVLVEQKEALGGSLRYGVSTFLFSGTDIQTENGVDDSSVQLLAEWEGFTGGDPTDPWVIAFAERNVPDVYDWLIARGVSFGHGLSWDESVGDTQRLHRLGVSGAELAGRMATELSSETAWLNTAAEALVRRGDGRYVGAVVRDQSTGEVGWVEAGAVVVATGGFLRNLDLVSWANPELDTSTLDLASGSHADGGGHALLEAAGASWDNPGAIGIYAHGFPDPEDASEELSFSPIKKTLYINQDGERFTNEIQYNSFFTGLDVLAQPGHTAWAVMDSKVYAELVISDPLPLEGETLGIPDEDTLLAGGMFATADALADLAGDIGVDADTLAAEVEAYNLECGTGEVDPWREVPVDTPPLTTGPYYALRITPSAAKAFGGIEVDLDGRVVDSGGDPIPGLYAAGELTGMAGGSLVGETGFTGSLSAVILSGRIAGAAAATDTRSLTE